MRRLPVAVLFNSYPLLLDVLEPSLRGEVEIAGRATTTADAALLMDAHEPDLLVAGVEAIGQAGGGLRTGARLPRQAAVAEGDRVLVQLGSQAPG